MPSMLETIVLGVFVVLLLMWWTPTMRAAIVHSRSAEKHWAAALWPLAIVILFVLGLIALT